MFCPFENRNCLVSAMSTFFVPEAAAGVRWNDPRFAIEWPVANPILSARDAGYPDYATP